MTVLDVVVHSSGLLAGGARGPVSLKLSEMQGLGGWKKLLKPQGALPRATSSVCPSAPATAHGTFYEL